MSGNRNGDAHDDHSGGWLGEIFKVLSQPVPGLAYVWNGWQQQRGVQLRIKADDERAEKERGFRKIEAEKDRAFRTEQQNSQQVFEILKFKLQILEQQQAQRRQFAKDYEQQRIGQEFQLDLFNRGVIKDTVLQRERLTSEENRDIKRQYVQWCMQRQQQAFADEQRGLSQESRQKLEEFRQNCTRGNLEWQFEQRQRLDWQLKQFDRETQIMLCDRNWEMIEQRKLIEKFPLHTLISPIIRRHRRYCAQGTRSVPALVFLSPPKLDVDQHGAQMLKDLNNLPYVSISEIIELELSDFIKRNYPEDGGINPAFSLTANAWETNRIGLDSAEFLLFDAFSSFPVIFMDSGIIKHPDNRDEDIFYLRITQWDAGAKNPSRPFDGDIKFTPKSLKNRTKFLSLLHQICAGLLLDEYHLFHHNCSPQLPRVLKDLLQDLSEGEALQLMNIVVIRYRTLLEKMEILFPSRVPESALRVAESLAYLPNQSWAREHLSLSNRVMSSLTKNFDPYNTPDFKFESE